MIMPCAPRVTKTDRPVWAEIASAVTTSSYQDSGLTPSTTFYYRVRGFNAAGLDTLSVSPAGDAGRPAGAAEISCPP